MEQNEEVRVVDPDTGGEKGSKLAQLGAVDPVSLLEVAEVAGFGAEKYERYNFLRGYDWSLSFDALQRHLLAFWSGQDLDPESGKPHMAHAAWHCLTLLSFMRGSRDKDNRPSLNTSEEASDGPSTEESNKDFEELQRNVERSLRSIRDNGFHIFGRSR